MYGMMEDYEKIRRTTHINLKEVEKGRKSRKKKKEGDWTTLLPRRKT